MATVTRESEWIDGAEACRILDLPATRNVERLVAEGLIQARALPGVRRRFRRSDCEKLAALDLVPSPKGHSLES